MRRSAIAVFCVLLVATLLSPSVAMAKGGNGRHSDSHGRTSEDSRARKSAKSQDHKSEKSADGKSAKSQDRKSDSGKAKATKPKAAPARRSNNAKVADKPARKSPGTKTAQKAESPQAMTYEQPPSAVLRTRATLGSPVPAPAAEDRISAVTVDAAGVETRGVIDTIRMSTDAWLRDMRANATGMWSSFTSRFGA